MIFLDSGVWLEYLLSGDRADAAAGVIDSVATGNERGLVAPTVITEVAYRTRVVADAEAADEAIRAITGMEGLVVLPLVTSVAEYAAELRDKYYERGTREFSYADAIHLATAVVHDDCHTLCTGDPDFTDVEEIETTVL